MNKKTIFLVLAVVAILAITFFVRQAGQDFTTPLFSLHMRLNYWQKTLEIICAHPFKGTTIGNFSLSESRFAHNSYLQLWAEAGLFAFLSYLGIVFVFFKKGVAAIRRHPDGYLGGFFIAGVVFIIHNLVDFTFFIPQVSFLWWVSLGCVLGYLQGPSR